MATISARMRFTSREKQRGQILSWTEASLDDLQLLLEVVRPHTDALLASELFAVDSLGAIAVGPWQPGPGAWAERKDAEFAKFREVMAWAAYGVGFARFGGASAGAAAASALNGASGYGGGVSAGTAGATGIPFDKLPMKALEASAF
ncbi:hypothetical protein CYMTET_52775 [Cymbomonas tetramitiformis]|uniref:Uncharacterized protein n=1 Tax=Cymbomonas tetramitiformis TaxID=36881 RepID=A0AAE0BK06_9CHLO|nr:hypothetical protein CYMTET_52775 [Cymbomonas tetramitiformis]